MANSSRGPTPRESQILDRQAFPGTFPGTRYPADSAGYTTASTGHVGATGQIGAAAQHRIRHGLLVVEVFNFEDLTEDGGFGGAEFEPAPRLQLSLISPELLRWTEHGPIPFPLGVPADEPLRSGGLGVGQASKGPKSIDRYQAHTGVACVGAPLLYIECRSSQLSEDEPGETPAHVALVCTELVTTEELADPLVHAWEQEMLKHVIRTQIEAKQALLSENPKDKDLANEIKQLEVDLDLPAPLPPTVSRNVLLLLEDGREGACISISLALGLDQAAAGADETEDGEDEEDEDDDAVARPAKCPRPVQEAFDAATSVLDLAISNAVDNWLDYVFQRLSRQYAAAFCLSAASAIIDMGELLPAGEPAALARSAHGETVEVSLSFAQTVSVSLSQRQSTVEVSQSARMSGGGPASRPPPYPYTPFPPDMPRGGKALPFPSPRASPRPPCDAFGAVPLGHQRMAGYPLDLAIMESPRELDTLPFWGYVSEEAVPAPIDSMARGVVPIRVKPTGDMTDSVLLVPGDQIPTASIGTGKNLLKPPASVLSRASSKTPAAFVSTHGRKQAEAAAALLGPKGTLGVAAGVTPVLMQCVAVCYTVLHFVACVACFLVCLRLLQRVAATQMGPGSTKFAVGVAAGVILACCSVLQCVVACCNVNHYQSRRHQRCRGCYCRCEGVVAGQLLQVSRLEGGEVL